MAKALHYVHFAIFYLEDVMREEKTTGSAKYFITELIKRLQWVIKQVYTRISASGADMLRKEIEGRDIATIDSIINTVIKMNDAQREELEKHAESLLDPGNYINRCMCESTQTPIAGYCSNCDKVVWGTALY